MEFAIYMWPIFLQLSCLTRNFFLSSTGDKRFPGTSAGTIFDQASIGRQVRFVQPEVPRLRCRSSLPGPGDRCYQKNTKFGLGSTRLVGKATRN